MPKPARSKLRKLRDALAAIGSAAAHPSATAKKAVAAAKAKLAAMHKKYGTTGTALILGAAIVATPIPVPGATPVAIWAVSKLLSVCGMAKKDEGKVWLGKADDPEELSEEEAERLGREFVEEFLAGCGLSPDLEPLEDEDEKSFFSECDRDEGGHCLPGGGGAGGGDKDKPAGGKKPSSEYDAAREAWEKETAELKEEYEEAREAWEKDSAAREAAHEQALGEWNTRQQERDARRERIDADHVEEADPGSVSPEDWQAAYGEGGTLEESLTAAGASEADVGKVRTVAARGQAAVEKAHQKAEDARTKHTEAVAKAKELEAAEPKEPEAPDDDADDAAWDRYDAAQAKYEDAHDRWESRMDAADERVADLDSKADELDDAVADTFEDHKQRLNDAVGKVTERLTAALDKEDTADPEPEEPDLEDEPDEPDYPDEPDPDDFDEDEPEDEEPEDEPDADDEEKKP